MSNTTRFALQFLKSSQPRLASALLPQDCVLCGDDDPNCAQTTDGEARPWAPHLCTACRDSLPYLSASSCPICALPSTEAVVCGRCIARPPHYDATRAAVAYAYPIEPLIRHCKYHGVVALAALLGNLLDNAIADCAPPDLLTAIPLSGIRLAQRGFNQALEIARPLAKRRGLVLNAGFCHRVRHTDAQADLPFAQRRNNVRGAFACTENLAGMHIAVVDDVMTTGDTLDEFARTLKARGAARVENWVVARTLPRG